MMGNKRPSEIRSKLARELKKIGRDPLRALEQRIATSQRQGKNSEVLESLQRVIEGKAIRKPGNRAKKRR